MKICSRTFRACPTVASASRETIARVLTMLRLTRWLSLVSRARDQISGRHQGSLYVLHDEPLTPAEAMELDQDYLELVGHALAHATKAVRIVAQHVVEEVRQDTNIDRDRLPTRLDSWGEHWTQQGLDRATADALRDSERGGDHRVRNRADLRSESEPGLNTSVSGTVRNPNAACTVLKESICTVPRATPAVDNLLWPTPLHLSPSEHQAVTVALNKLKPADRQAVLNEAGAPLCGRWNPQASGLSDGSNPACAERRFSYLGRSGRTFTHCRTAPTGHLAINATTGRTRIRPRTSVPE